MIKIQKTFDPYIPSQIRRKHDQMTKDFGRIRKDWGFNVLDYNVKTNIWTIEYWFKHDANSTIYALKYTGNTV